MKRKILKVIEGIIYFLFTIAGVILFIWIVKSLFKLILS